MNAEGWTVSETNQTAPKSLREIQRETRRLRREDIRQAKTAGLLGFTRYGARQGVDPLEWREFKLRVERLEAIVRGGRFSKR